MVFKHKSIDKQTTRVKNVCELYARMLLNNNVDWIKLKNVYNRSIKDEYAKYNIKKIIRISQPMITEKLIELTEKHGYNAQQVLELRKKVVEMALEKGDLTNLNKALDSFDTKLDLQPIKQISNTVTQTDYIKLIDKNKQSIEAKQTKQIESGEK